MRSAKTRPSFHKKLRVSSFIMLLALMAWPGISLASAPSDRFVTLSEFTQQILHATSVYLTGEISEQPEHQLNREEASHLLFLALKHQSYDKLQATDNPYIRTYFKDFSLITKRYQNEVLTLVQQGILSSNSDRTFNPKDLLTAREAQGLIDKVIQPSLRKPFNPQDHYLIEIKSDLSGHQGYGTPYLRYLDQGSGDVVNLFNLLALENKDPSVGYANLYDNLKDNRLELIVMTDDKILKENVLEALKTAYFKLELYLGKNPKKGYENYRFVLTDANNNATKRSVTFEAVLKYLFWNDYPKVLDAFKKLQATTPRTLAESRSTALTYNGRNVKILRTPTETTLLITAKVNEPLRTPEQLEVPLSKIQCASKYTDLKVTGPITQVCNETVNMIIDQLAQNKHLAIIDVRTPSEFKAGHIPSAINMPLDTLPKQLKQLKTYDTLLVYCKSGVRSAKAAELLASNGFTVLNFTEGYDHFKRLK